MSIPDDFFVGWSGRLPPAHRAGMLRHALFGAAVILGIGLLLGRAQDENGLAGGLPSGDVKLAGILTVAPFPTLFVAPDASHPRGHVLLLAGEGKLGPPVPPEWDGRVITAEGAIIRRGDLDMMQVASTSLQDTRLPPPALQSLGRWRVEGEICDGKCQAGAMQPGRGIAHRACAILCLNGMIPPVFVTTGPLAGHDFLLLGDKDGGPGDASWHALVGLRVRLDGEVQQRGDVLVFLADLAHAEVVK